LSVEINLLTILQMKLIKRLKTSLKNIDIVQHNIIIIYL